jgi:hypothetical protein
MENNLSFFYLSDIKRLFLKKKYYFICIFLFSLFFTAIFLLQKSTKFEAKATFFEDSEKSQTIGNLKDIVLSDSYLHSSDAFTFLKTKELTKKLVEKIGLQISLADEKAGFYNFYLKILKNLKIQLNKKYEDEEVLEFSDVLYDKNYITYFYLNVLGGKAFEIFDSKMGFIKKGYIDEPVKINNLVFTVNKIPQNFLRRKVKIKVEPVLDTLNEVLKNLEITKERDSPNFLFLKFRHSSEIYSTKILNSLMSMYHDHLVSENENFVKDQIKYLEKRKNDLEKELFSLIDENEKEISFNVKTKCFVSLDTEVEYLLNKRDNYQRLLDQTSSELDQLKKLNLIDIDKNFYANESILKIIDEIKKLQDKKQAFQISIDKDLSMKKNSKFFKKDPFERKNLIFEKDLLNDFLQKTSKSSLVNDNEIFFNPSCKNNLTSFLKTDNYQLSKSDDFEINKKKLSTLDLDTAKDINLQLDKSIEELELEISQLRHILKNINYKNFQFSAFSFFLSAEMIKNITEISKKIIDDKNYTNKEIEMLKHEYFLEKKCIISHLEELLNLKKLKLKNLKQKLFSLKKVQVNLIANEILFLSTKAKELIVKSIYEKTNEKKILEKNLNDVRINLQNLVTKMTKENKLNMKAEMLKNMIDSITKLIESKKLDLNLKKINSRVIDEAASFIFSIHFIRNSLIIALLTVFVFFIIFLYTFVLRGFALSEEAIKSLAFDYCGAISNKCNGIEVKKMEPNDLESLRKIITTIDDAKHKIITSICSKGPNYIHYLSALLALVGKKILVIETKSEINQKEGLFSFLEDDSNKLSIQKMQAYDFLPSGEKKYFAFELLKSQKFLEKLQQIKSKYDLIMIYSDAKVDSAEARIYLDISDKVILTFKEDTLEDIKLFINWAKEKTKLCFVTY